VQKLKAKMPNYLLEKSPTGSNLLFIKKTNSRKKYVISLMPVITHTHTHPFNGPFSGTIRVGRYQKGTTNLDFTEARDNEWQ